MVPAKASSCAILAFLVSLLAACDAGQANDPESAAARFLTAANRNDCAVAFSYYSSGTQQNIRDEVHRIRRETDSVTENLNPETRYCGGTYGGYKRGSARLVSQDGARAAVAVVMSEGTHLPLIPFLSTPYREWTHTLQLVQEDGQWKIDRPRVPIGRPGTNLVEVGPVDVTYNLGGDPKRRGVQAKAVLRAPREALDKVLLDNQAWASILPELTQVELAGEAKGFQQLRLRFADWEQPVLVAVKPYGSLVDAQLPWATLQWRADEAPVLFTGSWRLQPRSEGTWVTLSLVIEPGQWPAGLPERILSAERLAATVLALEKQALSRR